MLWHVPVLSLFCVIHVAVCEPIRDLKQGPAYFGACMMPHTEAEMR